MLNLKIGQTVTEDILKSDIFKFESDLSSILSKNKNIISEKRGKFRIFSIERLDSENNNCYENCKIKYALNLTDSEKLFIEEDIYWNDFTISGIEFLFKVDFYKHALSMLENRLIHISDNYGIDENSTIDTCKPKDDLEWLNEYQKCDSIWNKHNSKKTLDKDEINYVNQTVRLEGIFKSFDYDLFILNKLTRNNFNIKLAKSTNIYKFKSPYIGVDKSNIWEWECLEDENTDIFELQFGNVGLTFNTLSSEYPPNNNGYLIYFHLFHDTHGAIESPSLTMDEKLSMKNSDVEEFMFNFLLSRIEDGLDFAN